jgi:polyisoprenoid-binding protein YceI
MKHAAIPALSLLAIAAVLGCGNPADGKPEAVVREPEVPAAPASQPPAAADAAGETIYRLGPDTKIQFVGSKVTGSHDGGFSAFEGKIQLVDGDPTRSWVHVSIDTTSLWSDNPRLTEHLKSPDFFDVVNHPLASFRSTSIARADAGYTVTGNLSLHGVEKTVSFPATIAVEDGRVRASAEFFIKRFDFGIEYKGKADDLIRDEVVIKLDLVAAAG